MITLRQYQSDAIASISEWFEAGKEAPLVVTPTGSGKSVILAEFIRQACAAWRDTHILVVTHVKELVEQDAAKIAEIWPAAPLGIYSAGLRSRQVKQITVASIQSIYNKPHFYGRFDLIIVDEAHLIPHSSDGMYRKLLDRSREANPFVKLIGLTATPYRLDSGCLHEGDGALFDGISYEANVADLIEQGYLSPLTSRTADHVELDDIKTLGGEFNLGQLGQRMSALELVEHHADAIIEKCKERRAILVFCVTIAHAEAIRIALAKRGMTTGFVSGDTPNSERDETIRAFKAGELRCIVNIGVLTTGFDAPHTDAVVMLRPTLSPGLYVQMVGRGLRLAAGKTNCLVLDFGGNVLRHGFIDQVQPPKKGKKGEGVAPVKECDSCGLHVPISTKVCPECGFAFPIPEREAEKHHHEGAILSTEVKPIRLKVGNVRYALHRAKSGVPTLKVDYMCGFQIVSEWVCLQHEGYAREKAVRWWLDRTSLATPVTVDGALANVSALREPSEIEVSFAGKYPEIKRHYFEERAAA